MMNKPLGALSFGHALAALKSGERVARAGWNGKGMWLVLIPGHAYRIEEISGARIHILGTECLPWIGMKTADNKFVPWLASQTDMLADDWTVIT